jgi:hypothetical protein
VRAALTPITQRGRPASAGSQAEGALIGMLTGAGRSRRSTSFRRAGMTVKQERAHSSTPLPAIQPSSATAWKSASMAA